MIGASVQNLAGRNVSRETWDRLQAFATMVRRWNAAINLVSPHSLGDLWVRHIEDSAQVFDFCPPAARHWADLGAGGGFPGLVVAILAQEARPTLRVTLVEADQRKATFLRQAVRALALEVRIDSRRIEALPPLAADVVSARALAPLNDLVPLLARHLAPGGLAVLPKGVRHAEEVAVARRAWDLDIETHPSRSNADAAILIIRKFHRARPS
jgi:16S rRNA (guanine527-N7)-methyltransferase